MKKGEKIGTDSNMIRFFGENPFIKMLDVFIDNIGEEYTKKEIQELAGISKGTLFKHWSKLEELNIIKVTKQFGKTKLYTLDKKNHFTKDFLNMEARMIEETAPKK